MEPDGAWLQSITRLIEEGAIRPVVDRVFPFQSTPEAPQRARRQLTAPRSSARAIRCFFTVGRGTGWGRWLNQARTSSSSPTPCM